MHRLISIFILFLVVDVKAGSGLNKGEYCAAFRINFEFYCHGIWTAEKIQTIANEHRFEKIRKFCPMFKKVCIDRGHSTLDDTLFKKKKHHHKFSENDERHFKHAAILMDYEEILKKLSEIVPCTPECDQRVHIHCTHECKCDYDYPRIQRFCNPPPMPMFLNFCRLWYNSCPKYEQYHYSSQFVYSKAEKGKVVELPHSLHPMPSSPID